MVKRAETKTIDTQEDEIFETHKQAYLHIYLYIHIGMALPRLTRESTHSWYGTGLEWEHSMP